MPPNKISRAMPAIASPEDDDFVPADRPISMTRATADLTKWPLPDAASAHHSAQERATIRFVHVAHARFATKIF